MGCLTTLSGHQGTVYLMVHTDGQYKTLSHPTLSLGLLSAEQEEWPPSNKQQSPIESIRYIRFGVAAIKEEGKGEDPASFLGGQTLKIYGSAELIRAPANSDRQDTPTSRTSALHSGHWPDCVIRVIINLASRGVHLLELPLSTYSGCFTY